MGLNMQPSNHDANFCSVGEFELFLVKSATLEGSSVLPLERLKAIKFPEQGLSHLWFVRSTRTRLRTLPEVVVTEVLVTDICVQ